MRAAILSEENIVINIANSSREFAKKKGWIISEKAKIGDVYDPFSHVFTSPVLKNKSMEDAKSIKLSYVSRCKDIALEDGLPYTILGEEDIIQTRPEDKVNLLGIKVESSSLIHEGVEDRVVKFRGLSNVNRMLTPKEAFDVSVSALSYIDSVCEKAWRLKDKIRSSDTVEDLENIKW